MLSTASLERSVARKPLGHKPFVAFIIPTLWRPSLERSLASLMDQTVQNWVAVVIGEPHIEPVLDYLPSDPRIAFWKGPKEASGSAGELRNAGIVKSNSEWIAFLDDDDHVSNQYVEHLAEHTADHPRADVIIFRMDDPRLGVLPHPDDPKIAYAHVGISFAVRRSVMQNYNFIREDPAKKYHEDWELLKTLKESRIQMFLSQNVDYIVKGGTT